VKELCLIGCYFYGVQASVFHFKVCVCVCACVCACVRVYIVEENLVRRLERGVFA
jgi:hypothetical protein